MTKTNQSVPKRWNPFRGCTPISSACDNCSAAQSANRLASKPEYEGLTEKRQNRPVWTGTVRFDREELEKPREWKKPYAVDVVPLGDLFHDEISNEQIGAVFRVMAETPRHTFRVLTKRPERMLKWFEGIESGDRDPLQLIRSRAGDGATSLEEGAAQWPPPNVWLGVSVEGQAEADSRIPLLLKCPAALHWLCAEPLLGPVNLDSYLSPASPGLGWVVAAGEAGRGPGIRPTHPDWVRAIRNQCETAGVPFLFRRWGAWAPMEG